jgi:spore coat-associated protein N
LKRKIAMLLVSATLAIALLGGGVYAYFSDTETGAGNSFTAGSLDLVLGGTGSSSIVLTNLAPGMNGAGSMELRNAGTIGGTLSVSAINMVEDEGVAWEPEVDVAAPGDLSKNVDVTIFVDADEDGAFDAGETTLWTGKLNTLPGNNVNCGTLAGSDSVYIGMYWSIDTSVGNDIMGDITTFNLSFTLQQP